MNKNLLNSVQLTAPNRNMFDLTHDLKMSFDMGQLIPCMCEEMVPGDVFHISTESLTRFAPLISPTMHRFDISTHYFFVPNRIVWPGWEEWIMQKTPVPAAPFINFTQALAPTKSLADYMGIPTPTSPKVAKVSALPFAAYQMIYNEYYRDQNLAPEISFALTDGDNSSNAALRTLRTRAWEHDYFTSALPQAQAGSPVAIPLGVGSVIPNPSGTAPGGIFMAVGTTTATTGPVTNSNASGVQINATGTSQYYNPRGSLISQSQATSVTELRRAFKLQEYLERKITGGQRYNEFIKSMFGVTTSDARLQRPEYVTGTVSPITISEVLNTTGDTLPQGNMAGHGISFSGGKWGKHYAEEYGYMIGIVSIRPKSAYQQGIPRHFLKWQDQFMYYTPQMAHIGEQAIQNQEIYVDATVQDGSFGYTPRYSEYKFMNNRVAGDFRTTLNFWHMGRIFSAEPALNETFIQCNPGYRIFAVEDTENHIYCHILNKVKAVRPMPVFGTPSI